MATLDTDILIIGAGMSGLGLAVQLIRNYGYRDFQIVEKVADVGGTWLVNTYPGCGCDVASHFYSYSFELNPDWSQKFSMRSEIQAYFRGVAEKYKIVPHVTFNTTVEKAEWKEEGQYWETTLKNQQTKETYTKRSRILVSGVGNLSVPRDCEIPGADQFEGKLFHSALWDHKFDWKDKDVVVLGNGCSATQFVPVMSEDAKSLTQFARQAQYLAERPNPVYSPAFKALMRYMPFAMKLYRLKLYADMEKDFASMETEGGASIRQGLIEENERYVKRTAPQKYWNALIPKHEIGCKRKVMDTGYLACLHKENVELISSDPVTSITPSGVLTASGRELHADAIVLATGFQVFRMLFPMEIYGQNNLSLQKFWDENHQGAAQAYLGTCIPGFPNFFTLMGPNTVTGHLSVIYTVECQINFILRLIEPLIKSKKPTRSLLPSLSPATNVVDVKADAAKKDSSWMQSELKKLVWSSGCTNWALDPSTGMNIAMYPGYQFTFWLRSVFIPGKDFEYVDEKKQRKSLSVGGWKGVRDVLTVVGVVGVLAGGVVGFYPGGIEDVKGVVKSGVESAVRQGREVLRR
jgi:cation diffusion facilitator CzcD-associated flavoprotein CzcO